MEENITTDAYISNILPVDIGLTLAGSSLSVIGAIVIYFAHYLRWKNGILIEETRKYLLFLTFADLCNAGGYLWGVVHFFESTDNNTTIRACHHVQETACVAQSFVTTLFSMSSFFWTTLIACHLYSTYGVTSRQIVSMKKRIIYHISGWIFPLIIVIIATSMGVLGADLSLGSGAWCWISACLDQTNRTIWMTVTGKGWEILMYFLCFAFYLLIKWEKKKRQWNIDKANHLNLHLNNQIQQECGREEDIRFLYLWMIEVALRICGTIRYIMSAIQRHSDRVLSSYLATDKVLLHIQSFGDTTQAFTSCILFCVLEKETRALLKNTITCRANKKDEEMPIISS